MLADESEEAGASTQGEKGEHCLRPRGERLLITPGALARRLGDPALRVFDCTVILEAAPTA
jgi:hypothetical protein